MSAPPRRRPRRASVPSAVAVLAIAVAATLPAQAQAVDDARVLADQQRWSDARAVLEQRLQQAPGDSQARFLLARVLSWDGQAAQALPLYRTLLVAEPGNVDYLLGYGQALAWSGQADAAVPVLARAQSLAPANREVSAALAQARAAGAAQPPSGVDADAAPDAARPNPAIPAEDRYRRRSLALSARHDRLDAGLDDWSSLRLDAVALPAAGTGWYGALARERRFGSVDAGLEAGAIVPLRGGWSLQPEIGLAPDARFLPGHYLDLRVQHAGRTGWVAAASLRGSEYDTDRVLRLALAVERYAGPWRAGYTLNVTRLGGEESVGHDLRLARGYGERNEIGLQLAAGREATVLGSQVLSTRVRAISLVGRHGLGGDWSLLWNLGVVEQGDLYTRRGIGAGLERRF